MNPFVPLPCIALDCIFPSDLELYGLQGPNGPWSWLAVQFSNYPYDPATGLVRVPVPGFGGFEWISPGLIPNIFSAQSGVFSQRLRCCDGTYILVTIPAGMAPAARTALLQRAFAAVAQRQAYCNRLAKISATNRPKPYNPRGRPPRPLKLQPWSGEKSNTIGACIGVPFTKTIAALGQGIPPFGFEAPDGGVPPGLQESENKDGTVYIISGRPTQVGQFPFLVRVVDSSTPVNVDVQQFEIDVMGITNSPPNSNGEIPMPDAQIGYPYVQQLNASGGTAPYTFIEDTDFPLPDWVTLSSSGLLTGTPKGAESDLFGVIFTDSTGKSCKSLINIQVYDVHFTNYPPPTGLQCSAYTFQFTAAPAGCTFSGTCPPGLVMNSSGAVSGKPNSTGVQQFNITATDAHGRHATQQWTINVASALLGYYTAVQDFTYAYGQIDAAPGVTTAHSGSGGVLNWAGQITTGGAGQAGANDRIVGGLGVCGGVATYQVNFSLAYSLNTTTLTKNVRLQIRVGFGGVGNIIPPTTINATQLSQGGVLSGSLLAGWAAPILQASILFEFDLFADALPAGQSCGASVTMSIAPLTPP